MHTAWGAGTFGSIRPWVGDDQIRSIGDVTDLSNGKRSVGRAADGQAHEGG